MQTENADHFAGRLILEALPDGRLMRVVEPYKFVESDGLEWPVPPGTEVDGASIPQPLWSFIGGPFEGKYRNASVIHDYYCDVRTAAWQAVHRIFYRGMRVSGVSEFRAKLMYTAVYFGGPRWGETVTKNVLNTKPVAPSRPDISTAYYSQMDPFLADMSRSVIYNGKPALDFIGGLPAQKGGTATLLMRNVYDILSNKNIKLKDMENAIDAILLMLGDPLTIERNLDIDEFPSNEE